MNKVIGVPDRVNHRRTDHHAIVEKRCYIAQNRCRFKANEVYAHGRGICPTFNADSRPGRDNIEDVVASAPPVCYIWGTLMMLDTKAEQDRMPLSLLSAKLFPPLAVSFPQRCLAPTRTRFFPPISAICENHNPLNIHPMHPKCTSFLAPEVLFFTCLDLEQQSLFSGGHDVTTLKHNPRSDPDAHLLIRRANQSTGTTHDLQEVR